MLATLYDQGRGVDRDLTQAFAWYRRAANQGQPQAQFNLGDFYRQGIAVEADPVEAYKWWRLAAAKLDIAAQNLRLLARGMGQAQITDGEARARRWRPAREGG